MIEIRDDQNAVLVRAHDHSRIAVLRDGAEVASENSGRAEVTFVLPAGAYDIETDGVVDEAKAIVLDLAFPAPAVLRLTSDAPDQHVIDGVGEIAADGNSFCTLTIERGGGSGEVFLRTTGGTLMDARGKARIRSVKLRRGKATFRLVSEATPRLVTVYAFGEREQGAELPIEFV